MAAAGRLSGLVVVPVGIHHFVFSQPSEAAALRRKREKKHESSVSREPR